ncbi:winged helix DNA-binding domain-containing protein [Daedalea quercina L-15889]|uniref:Winged helix DNA-binding domain-containing protein n=1 Tax=Daedalea quercina L-15889 TaxID=1314783 RepID=A0A165N4W7_9APHY|nr:winged helix DNA-binding domain-containing protein [Daedalea quercina L-15889]
MLFDPAIPGEKPNYPYPLLVKAAILGSPRRALTLQEIFSALEERFDWYRDHKDGKAWQRSIRHNLSLNKMFRKVKRPVTEPGKGCYWTVDFTAGQGNKRAKRIPKCRSTKRATEGDSRPAFRWVFEYGGRDTEDISRSLSMSPYQTPGANQILSTPNMLRRVAAVENQ